MLTCNPDAFAATHFERGTVFVFPKNREPYTYNTSTYMEAVPESDYFGRVRECYKTQVFQTTPAKSKIAWIIVKKRLVFL